MRRLYALCKMLVVCACLSTLARAAPSTAQVEIVPYTIHRVAPPAAGASAEELEKTGDQLRSEEVYLDAFDYYQAALVKKPNDARLYNKVGIVELQLQRYKQARRDFEKSIKLEHSFASTYNNLGALYSAQRNYGAAIKQYKKAIQLEPGVATYYANMGAAYFAKREFEPAGVNYARALELDPDVLERHSRTGISSGLQSPEEAARYAFILARLYAKRGAIDRSLEYLRRAIEAGYKGIGAVYRDSEFAGIRSDPRFADLMAPKPLAFTE